MHSIYHKHVSMFLTLILLGGVASVKFAFSLAGATSPCPVDLGRHTLAFYLRVYQFFKSKRSPIVNYKTRLILRPVILVNTAVLLLFRKQKISNLTCMHFLLLRIA